MCFNILVAKSQGLIHFFFLSVSFSCSTLYVYIYILCSGNWEMVNYIILVVCLFILFVLVPHSHT